MVGWGRADVYLQRRRKEARKHQWAKTFQMTIFKKKKKKKKKFFGKEKAF